MNQMTQKKICLFLDLEPFGSHWSALCGEKCWNVFIFRP